MGSSWIHTDHDALVQVFPDPWLMCSFFPNVTLYKLIGLSAVVLSDKAANTIATRIWYSGLLFGYQPMQLLWVG